MWLVDGFIDGSGRHTMAMGHSFTLGTTRYNRRSRLGGRARDRLRLGARDRARDLIG